VKEKLIEGEDFYYSEEGYIVLTEKYHLEKGYCCGNGCRHCPYEFENVPEPHKSQLQQNKIAHGRQ
jgi:Family of unknown function (DUF5522)